jgi:hypothetical protein
MERLTKTGTRPGVTAAPEALRNPAQLRASAADRLMVLSQRRRTVADDYARRTPPAKKWCFSTRQSPC